jgi:hypothetical protein
MDEPEDEESIDNDESLLDLLDDTFEGTCIFCFI